MRVHLIGVFVLAVGCSTTRTAPLVSPDTQARSDDTTSSEGTRSLRVALFPYIPPFHTLEAFRHGALRDWLTERFESQHPDIDLHIVFEAVGAEQLRDGPDAFDLIEIDLTYLDSVLNEAGEWHLPQDSLLPGALQASTRSGRTFAWPTYACTHIIYSTDEHLSDVDSIEDLANLLEGQGQGGNSPLVADLWGSSTTPALFVDAYVDSIGYDGSIPVEDAGGPTIANLRRLFGFCGSLDRETNECLKDTFDPYYDADDNVAGSIVGFQRFARGESLALFGYSEFIYYVLRQANSPSIESLRVVSAPLGAGSHPVIYVDGLIRNRRCTNRCQTDAEAFAHFLTQQEMQVGIAFGEDTEPAVPRYLLMSHRAFWSHPRVASDPLYRQLWPIVEQAPPIPTSPMSRTQIWEAVVAPSR